MSANSLIVTLLGLVLGQPGGLAPNEVVFRNERVTQFPLNIKPERRAEVREILLYVSNDQGVSWNLASKINPSQDSFAFTAPIDGVWWLRLALVDQFGKQTPENLNSVPPSAQLVVDTLKPLVKLANCQRVGNEVVLAWEIREDNPEWTTFRLEYLPAGSTSPIPVSAAPGLTGQTRFTPSTNGPVTVRLSLRDKAGNESSTTGEVSGLDGVAVASGTGLPPVTGGTPLPSSLMQSPLPPVNPIPQPTPVDSPAIPSNPTGTAFTPPSRSRPFTDTRTPTQLTTPGGRWQNNTAQYQAPTNEKPIATTEYVPPAVVQAQHHVPAPAPAARKPLPPLQYVNSPVVLLEYELSKVGPSGVGSVEIFYTLNDGQTWELLAADDRVVGKTSGGRHNGQVELGADGIYGFTLVVKSQAQVKQEMASDDRKTHGPQAGDVPDIRVEVDTSAPTAEMYPPRRDPNKNNSLVLLWKATDKNLGANPVTLEWAERRDGQWMPIATNLPNTGKHSWQLPDRLPVEVYLRLRVVDLAGNEGVATTPQPITVDLSEPEGRLVNVTVPPRDSVSPRR
jgi:hypothetical protein